MEHPFVRSSRFEYRRRIGSGSFGVVYEAYDRERELPVALKVLRSAESDALFFFKREFRALADLNHRNLVTLYELFADGPDCFFTMELLEGRDFISHAWSVPEGSVATPAHGSSIETSAPMEGSSGSSGSSGLAGEPPVRPAEPGALRRVDYSRLRETLRQLARGLNALHAAGKLHRDIKPSNILVTTDGRAVLLDFGLVSDVWGATRLNPSVGTRVVGTPAYMSPEQAAGATISAASDWYAVGAMLFEALTGRLPFAGSVVEMMLAKQIEDARLPSGDVPHVPTDLADLCRDLLAREPARRLDGREVLARLGAAPAVTRARTSGDSDPFGSFVGRQRELGLLADAFASVKRGQAVTVYVHGVSGMGKTTVVRRFLHDLGDRDRDAVVLTGRCYQQESVPYKAFDPLVDEMSQWLTTLPAGTVEALLPRDVPALVRLFPVLGRVKAVDAVRRRAAVSPDAQELRRRAVTAFRELLARLAERWPLVLFIDDLQWGDLDSTRLIADVLRAPDPPKLLLIASYRSDETETSPPLRELLALHRAGVIAADRRDIPLDELTEAEVWSVMRSLAGAGELPPALAGLVHRESGGNPFFVGELARLAESRGEELAAGGINLESAIAARIGAAAEPASRLVKVLALAACPLPLRVALDAAGLDRNDYTVVPSLRVAQLIRSRETDRTPEIELYHDRIRAVVAGRIESDEAVGLHGRLARALEAAGSDDPEALAFHFTRAGEITRAADHAAVAADRALAALAFDRAARLYEVAIGLLEPTSAAVVALRLKRAEALANAGRGSAAAEAYLLAAEGADQATFVELQRRAAEQFLMSGHIDRGLAALENVLRAQHMRLARTPWRAMALLVLRRMIIRLRGLHFTERDASALPPARLLRIDSCWSVAIGLAFVDNIRAAEFQARHCLLALRSGEPARAAGALALEASFSATGGTRTSRRTEAVASAALSLAERLHNPAAIGRATLAAGVAAHLEGRWRASLDLCGRAEKIFRSSCTGVTWEIDTAGVHMLDDLLCLGDLNRLCRRAEALIKDARTRGDLYGETAFRLRAAFIAPLRRGDPRTAMDDVDAADAAWSQRGFLLQHYWGLMARLDILAYQGEGAAAYDLITRQWRYLASAQLLKVQFSTVTSYYRRGRSALMVALDLPPGDPRRADLLRRIRRDASRLRRERAVWSVGLGHLLDAGASHADGSADDERLDLVRAEECFTNAGMGMHVAMTRLARARLVSAEQGRTLRAEGERWCRANDIADVPAFGRMIAGRSA